MRLSGVTAIVETRARRTRRQLLDSTRLSLATVAFVGLISLGVVAPGGRGTYALGQMAASGEWEAVTRTVTDGFVVGSLALFVLGTFRSAVAAGRFDDKEALNALSVTLRTQLTGKLVSEWLVYPAMLLLPLSIGSIAFAVGAGPLAGAGLFLTGLSAALTVSSLSYPVGVAFVYLTERLALSGRQRVLLGLAGLGAGEAIIVYRETVLQYATVPPVVWFPEVALGATPAVAPGVAAVVVVATAPVVSLVAAVLVTERLISYVWFRSELGERDTSPDAEPSETDDESLLPLARAPRLSTRVSALADLTIRRTVREPSSLVRGAVGVVVVALVGVQTLQTSTPDAVFPPVAVMLVGTVSGIGPLLNPLGNDEAALPTLLGSGTQPSEYVASKLVAGYVLTVPVVLVTVVVTLLLAGVTAPPYVAATVSLAVVAAVTLPVVAVGIGCALPELDDDGVVRGRRLVRSNNVATAAFSLLSLLLLLPGTGAAVALGTAETGVGLDTLAGSLVVSVAGLSVTGVVAHRVAVVSVQRFSVDGHGSGDTSFDDLNPDHDSRALRSRILAVGVAVLIVSGVFVATTLAAIPLALVVGTEPLQTRTVGTALTAVVVAGIAVGFASLFRGGVGHFDFEWPTVGQLSLTLGAVVALVAVQFGVDRAALVGGVDPGGVGLSGPETVSVVGTFLVATLLAAPAEELLYRNVVQKRLRRSFDAPTAILATSLLFAATHAPNFLQVSVATASVSLVKILSSSLVLGWLYERTESVLTSVLCHAAFNGLAVVTTVAVPSLV